MRINLKEYTIEAPSLLIMLPDQTIQIEDYDENLLAFHVFYSDTFINKLDHYFIEKFPLYLDIQQEPIMKLNEEDAKQFVTFYSDIKQTLCDNDNPYKEEIMIHQTMLFFYSTSYKLHKTLKSTRKTNHEILTDKFLMLVKENFLKHRSLDFYADRLYLTPKYLSTVIKTCSGTSASEWIEKIVILEAQALLKSTNATVQEISYSLNFPSQTFFGKYFKRLTGMSPMKYRKDG